MTRKSSLLLVLIAVVGVAALALGGEIGTDVADQASAPARYDVAATAIEACSCPLFCSCYYNSEPAGGHMCKFNNAYRFEDGSHWGEVDLSGAKVWLSGDLGNHFGDGKTEWAVVTFDRASTPEQRAAINQWIGRVFPVQWEKVEVREDDLTWENGAKVAHAKMGSGMAEVSLQKVLDADGDQATVLNTQYWASDSNNGFQLAYGTHHFHGSDSYDYENRNGFLITSRVSGAIE